MENKKYIEYKSEENRNGSVLGNEKHTSFARSERLYCVTGGKRERTPEKGAIDRERFFSSARQQQSKPYLSPLPPMSLILSMKHQQHTGRSREREKGALFGRIYKEEIRGPLCCTKITTDHEK